MIRFFRDLRLISIAVIASVCLLVLKAADLVLDREPDSTIGSMSMEDTDAALTRSTGGLPRAGDAPRSWAQQMFNFPDSGGAPERPADFAALPAITPMAGDTTADRAANGDIITGTIPGEEGKGKEEAPDAAKDGKENKDGKDGKENKEGKEGKPGAAAKDVKEPAATPNGRVIVPNQAGPSGAERALLDRLQERRQELDRRARELDIREGLIAEAEKRMEARLTEIKQAQAQVATASEKKDEAEAARFKGLVTMYENMKPRDAAKIFDRLNVDVLLEVASQINPRRMSDILALMAPDTAEKLTVELANRAKAVGKGHSELPKIEGRPTAQ
jgi:flagellar motility protein MotE (MotC chaperone)